MVDMIQIKVYYLILIVLIYHKIVKHINGKNYQILYQLMEKIYL